METDVKTFRGRTLDELLPQIREELGPDAIVLRRREGLSGGVAGFFQRSFVEVEARRPEPGELPLEARNDRATEEGLSTPGVQKLIEQASPFADALARAEGSAAERAGEVLVAAARGEAAPTPEAAPVAAAPVAAGLYGPQPAAFVPDTTPLAVAEEAPVEVVAPAVIAAPPALERPAAADAAEQRLVAAGLSAGLAADVVGEAVSHGLPFAQPRALKKLIRAALARRIPVMADLGPDRRVIAVAGAAGAGKTALVGRLAAAYAAADHEVVVLALRSRDGGNAAATALNPLGVSVLAADDAQRAARRLSRREPLVTLIDLPALGAGDAKAAAALATEVRALGCTEVHLALPATISPAAADEVAGALAPLGLTHIALTHADQTARPGAALELAVRSRRPLSYVATGDTVAPADAAEFAARLLP